ncbi:hypothetical protein, partial [Flavobacterium sp.]|uniref:hypothetical protein n=1 Tax=Flavobacterium sp. TaxID=239 RepID=UPI002624FED4
NIYAAGPKCGGMSLFDKYKLRVTYLVNNQPEASVTIPLTVLSCAKENCIDNATSSVKIHLNFNLILINFELVGTNIIIKT